jgi:hypothetical protein
VNLRLSEPGSDLYQIVRILVFVVALGVAALGLVGAGVGVLVSILHPTGDSLTTVTLSVSVLALASGLGLALAWQAWQSILGKASGPFRPPRIGLWVLLFLLAIAAGQSILSLDLLPAFAFPPFHILAAVLPALIILAAVGRSVGSDLRWREVVLEISSGAFLATFLAFALELAAVFGILMAVLAIVMVQPGGLEVIQGLMDHLQDPAWLQDPAALAPEVLSPAVLGLAFLLFAGIVPAIEEAVKTLGVGLLIGRRPDLSRAFLWGLACGAGFALAEGLFNAAGGLEAWAFVASLRTGATALHCFTGGLMGIAWYYVVIERRVLRGLGLYVGSVALHGAWNTLAAGAALVSLGTPPGQVASIGQDLAGVGTAVILALLLLLACGTGFGLWSLTRHVRRLSSVAGLEARPGPSSPLRPVDLTGTDEGGRVCPPWLESDRR